MSTTAPTSYCSSLAKDESRILLFPVDGPVRFRRRIAEGLMEQCLQNKVAGGGGSVHVWGAFCKHGKCDLVILDQNVTRAVYRDILV